jgi:replication factor C subunit 2/4
VKSFAATKSERIPDRPNFKIIILDESDHLTKDAQNALRRIIEDYTELTRFVLICNYITKIIEPLNSRCMKFRFKQIPKKIQIQRLKEICTKEKLKYNNDAIESVVDISLGDLRKALNLLQMANSTKYENQKISKEDVLSISDVLPCENPFEKYVHEYLGIRSTMSKTIERDQIEFIDEIVKNGITAQQFIKALYEQLKRKMPLKPLQKARIFVALTEAEESVLLGVDDHTVLSLLLNQIEDIMSK